jgi:polysaccharide export outer membrane protein
MRNLKVLMLACLLGPLATAMAAEVEVQPPKAGPGQFDEGSTYIIGPGDALEIFVWRTPEYSATVTVRPDGKVSTRGVDDMLASGQTPSGLARLIEARLAEYVRTPQVNVIVVSAKSENSKVTVLGKVGSPQSMPYRQGMTAMDLVLAAGGLSDFAKGNDSKILRKGPDGKLQEIPVKLKDIFKRNRLKEDVPLQPGDVLSVPESRF